MEGGSPQSPSRSNRAKRRKSPTESISETIYNTMPRRSTRQHK